MLNPCWMVMLSCLKKVLEMAMASAELTAPVPQSRQSAAHAPEQGKAQQMLSESHLLRAFLWHHTFEDAGISQVPSMRGYSNNMH